MGLGDGGIGGIGAWRIREESGEEERAEEERGQRKGQEYGKKEYLGHFVSAEGGVGAVQLTSSERDLTLPHKDPTTAKDFPHCRCKTLQLLII